MRRKKIDLISGNARNDSNDMLIISRAKGDLNGYPFRLVNRKTKKQFAKMFAEMSANFCVEVVEIYRSVK